MERQQHAVEPIKVKTGDLMAFTFFTTVKQVEMNGGKLVVYDVDNKREMAILGPELVGSAYSADQYAEEIRVNKTEAAQILIDSPNRPMTVCFEKQSGEERTMRCRLVRHEALLGRSMVEDLDQTGDNRLRQVDHRTIKFIIVDGTKYIVK